MLESRFELLGVDPRTAQRVHHEWGHSLVELEDHVSDEAVADDDVHLLVLGAAGGEIASLDVADEVEPRTLEQRMRLLRDRVPLLGLFTDAQQSHRRIDPAEDALRIGGAKAGELDELLGRTVHIGAGVQHGHRAARRGEEGEDRGSLETRVQAKQYHRGGHLCARAAGGDEAVRAALGLETESDGHRAVGLPAHHGTGLVRHLHDVGRLDDLEAVALSGVFGEVAVEAGAQLRLHDGGAADELNAMSGIELGEREQRAGNGRLGGKIPPHGVQRDPRQGQASLAATRCSPA